MDVATFRSYYRRLETTGPGSLFFVNTPAPPHLVVPLILGNDAHARTYGGEVFAIWNITNRWRISPGYSLIHMNVIRNPLTQDSSAEADPGDTPKHQIQFRSTLGLRRNLDWDTSVYFVGRLSEDLVPSYTRLDTQLRWRIGEAIEIGITGQNLLTPRHSEFGDAFEVNYTQVQRSVLGKIIWRF